VTASIRALRVLIVDDEVHARKKMRALLAGRDDVVVAGECDNGADAVAKIRRGSIDLVFLDVQMPGMTGLDVVREVGAGEMPMVVFATAFDRFAVDAFEAYAVDYLLKPVDPEHLDRALARARERLRSRAAPALEALLDRLGTAREYARRFAVKSGGAIHVIDVDAIDWVEADGNYVTFHAGGKTYLHRETLTAVERALDPERFVRVHRSYVVSVERVERLDPDRHGDYTIVMSGGARIPLARTYRQSLLDRIGGER
jgi:two-component system LytT family response regulator